VVGEQLELLSAEVLMEIFQRPHIRKSFPTGNEVISLDLVQHLTVIGDYSLLPALYL
jgi:hypothetical protein